MDVQMESMDPPPCESQPSGKIRKGFKLFGKRKPGNIFSIRSKGDGNNKSPVIRSKASDGLSETTAPDSEQEPDKAKGQGMNQGEREQAEEEQLGEDGVLAAAPARTSISSASSAKSLSFLSLLRGGRRGVGDRRVHTVSQPVGRQRRGLKGLFGNVKFRSKDKEDKEEAPPSPLLMSSRANSVEIIKEDLTLTPKTQPRSLDSPETESCEPIENLAAQDSAATSPSEMITPQATAVNVSKTNEHVPPLPASEPPMVPGDKSLSSLLADISSLLTFDSISGGGDIMADVEAEWGKASSAISAVTTEITPSSTSLFSKPTISSPVKPSLVAISTTASTQSFTPFTKTTSTSSPSAKPSTIITTLTKSATLTTHKVTLSSDSTPVFEASTSIKIKSIPTSSATQPATTYVALTSSSAPKMSSPLISKSIESSTSTTATAPPNTPATVVKAPSVSPTLTSTASKLVSEIVAPASVSKPTPVTPPAPLSSKPLPVTQGPPTLVSFVQHPHTKLDSASSTYKPLVNSGAGESKAPEKASPASTVITTPSSPAPVVFSKVTTATTSYTNSGLVSAALSKAPLTYSPSLVAVPSSTLPTTTKTQPSPASVQTPSSASLDKIPSITKSTPATFALDKMSPIPTPTAVPPTHVVISTASPTPADLGQILLSHFKTPPAPAEITVSVLKDSPPPAQVQVFPAPVQIPVSVSKDSPAPVQNLVSVSKVPPAPVQIPVSVSKDPSAAVQIPVSVSKVPPAPVQIPVSVSKVPPAPVQIPVSVSKVPPAPVQIPVSVSKDPLASVQIPVSVSKVPPAPVQVQVSVSKDHPDAVQIPVSVSKVPPAAVQIPVSVSKDPPAVVQIPVSVSKDPPAPVQIPVSVSKDPPAPVQISVSVSKVIPATTPAPSHVTSTSSTPALWPNEPTAAAKMRGSGQASVDGQLTSPSSTDALGAQCKTEELHESRTSLQGSSRERRTQQVKASGLSKIPVVGGSKAGKLPVRDSQHGDDEPSRVPPTPVPEEERSHLNSHDAGNKDKICDVEANVPTSKHTLEESQQLPQPKALSNLPRDSKIPVKHSTQSHTASQIPQAKEPHRTKIPVSKVPVRRAGNKPAASGGSTQIRK